MYIFNAQPLHTPRYRGQPNILRMPKTKNKQHDLFFMEIISMYASTDIFHVYTGTCATPKPVS